MANVSLRRIVKEYDGGVQAVKGIDLEIADHEFVVLVGPSGCGKSTTLRMIAGLEEISSGDIAIGGTGGERHPPRDRDIAMVFQNYALYPHMTVFDNMAFGLLLRKFPRDEIKRRVDNAARILDITPLLDRKPKALSAGSASASPWAAPSCATPRCSCSTSRSPTSTPSCACRCAPRSRRCTRRCAPPPSTSPMTRWRR
jgi:ABC-type sugar transport system ATPase subunit